MVRCQTNYRDTLMIHFRKGYTDLSGSGLSTNLIFTATWISQQTFDVQEIFVRKSSGCWIKISIDSNLPESIFIKHNAS